MREFEPLRQAVVWHRHFSHLSLSQPGAVRDTGDLEKNGNAVMEEQVDVMRNGNVRNKLPKKLFSEKDPKVAGIAKREKKSVRSEASIEHTQARQEDGRIAVPRFLEHADGNFKRNHDPLHALHQVEQYEGGFRVQSCARGASVTSLRCSETIRIYLRPDFPVSEPRAISSSGTRACADSRLSRKRQDIVTV